MTLFELSLYTILLYICVFGVVNRICKCIEHGHTCKASATKNESN